MAEEVQMALEGGCKWIQLHMDGSSDEEFRQTAVEIIPMCQEHEAFLVFEDRVELAMETGVHGVVLTTSSLNPLQARETMGAEAIIGVTARTAEDILRFKGWDVDYVELGPCHSATSSQALGTDGYKTIVEQVRKADMLLPVVAVGGVTVDDVPALMSAGINGVAAGTAIISASDPVKYTRDMLVSLKASAQKQ
ncbi:MAG: thiamine phosphate synthase [Duncaniella sp.]|nr:thiamine phosphate synthase [Duncaniella sp.]